MPKVSQPENVSGSGFHDPQAVLCLPCPAAYQFSVAIKPWLHVEIRKYKSLLSTSQDLCEEVVILLSLLANLYV